ncbi:alpha/beta fold hydrolase [Halocatena halophila]|uniref:alpha/beta fold hydrolase n=1 Tax=Halocatena halophila TaxID=2814576 RepID=UPI002ED4E9E1
MDRRDVFTTVDGLEIHHTAWGDNSASPVVCVHGLSRNGRDFDPIAAELASTYHVLCPDLPGRGLSEWCEDTSRYTNASMIELLITWLDTLNLDSVRWIGTSMGAGLGMALAGGPLHDRITKLVINDMCPDPGADAEAAAIERIATYVGTPPVVDTISAFESYLREIYGDRVSPMTDEEYQRMAITSSRRTDDGRVTANYDPSIVDGLNQTTTEESGADPWTVYESIDADICLVQGTESAICPDATFERMTSVHPDCTTLRVPCGHHPALNTPEQISPISNFLAD